MAKGESNILNEIRLRLSGLATTFRNHVGQIKGEDGKVHRFGLCKGSSDIIGWKSVEITPGMVGKQVAIFMAIEAKAPRGRPTKSQITFIENVRDAGGIAFVARSDGEAAELLTAAVARYSGDGGD